MKHPVLDHTASLRRQADRFGLHCTATEWLGWDQSYAFRCTAGHEFMLAADLLRQEGYGGCRMCRDAAHLRRLHETAGRKGLQCLSTEWVGEAGPYLFECAQGHRWHNAAITTPRCKLCGPEAGLQRLQQAAATHGGQCLSEAYAFRYGRYRFRCAEGHEWETSGQSVFSGRWCPVCAGIQRRTVPPEPQQELARLREVAQAKGGTCLDQESPGVGARYRFLCSQGHEWTALAERVLRLGAWCRPCSDAARGARAVSKEGLKRLQALAAERGGECLSTEYKGGDHRVRLRCARGHEWEAKAAAVLQGTWCRRCVIDAGRLSIKDAQEAAAARGGQCLSQTYVNAGSKLTWMCERGHVWQARLGSIRHRGSWCKQCWSMSLISDRNSKARIKYQAAGRGLDTTAPGGATEAAPAKLMAPASGTSKRTSKPARPQGALNLTTRSGDTEARTPVEDNSMT
jgi:hypothetical protein